MHVTHFFRLWMSMVVVSLLFVSACGGGEHGAAVNAAPQTITFGPAPALMHLQTATVTAIASSGLPVSYRSTTPAVCSVDAGSGLVISLATGDCTIGAKQRGNRQYAAAAEVTQTLSTTYNRAQTIAFEPAPTLSFGGTATVRAVATSGLAVMYSSQTPAICSVEAATGRVTNLQAGTCSIAANQGGNANFDAATEVTQSLTVAEPAMPTVPGAPATVTATLGAATNTAVVAFSDTNSGGSAITGYTVTSEPVGITASGASSPLTVTCPTTHCRGYAFRVTATNAIGTGASSALAPVMATYRVVETFYEPDTQPNDSIFIGTFDYNFSDGTVARLRGVLSESMTGGATAYPNDSMTWLTLDHQLYTAHDAGLGGTFVAVFKNADTRTLSGGNGWAISNATASGYYAGYPGANPGNAYALIFVPDTEPTTTLSSAQINALTYVDCAPGGMMGDVCMTGAWGGGTMGGYPRTQVITKQ